MVLTRRFDAEATALQRQGELGPVHAVPGPGGRAGRLRPRARPAGLRLPVLPRARRAARARHGPGRRAQAVPRRRPRRLGHRRAPRPPVHAGRRRPPAARGRLRDGRAARRPRRARGTRSGTPPWSRTSATARRRRATSARRWCSRAVNNAPVVFFCRTTSGRSRSRPPPRAGCRSPSAGRASACRACGWTATTCWPATRSPPRRWSAPAPAAARRSSRRTPTGWARTPRPTTRRATARPPRTRHGARRTRSTGCAATWSRRRAAAGLPRRPRGARRRAGQACARRRARDGPAARRRRCSSTSTPPRTPWCDAERAWFRAVRGRASREGQR